MACVNAQAQAALTTLNFVKSVGFDDSGEAIYVQFVFNRTNGTTGDVEENKIDVPMLTILPIPYLRVSVRLFVGALPTPVSSSVDGVCVHVS